MRITLKVQYNPYGTTEEVTAEQKAAIQAAASMLGSMRSYGSENKPYEAITVNVSPLYPSMPRNRDWQPEAEPSVSGYPEYVKKTNSKSL